MIDCGLLARAQSVLLLAGILTAGCGAGGAETSDSSVATPQGTDPTVAWGLVVHGGAGTITRESMTPEREAAYRGSLEQALRAGHAVLAADGAALDAVVAAVQVLEDDSLFNAGRGAVFTSDERNELDAAIMDGSTRRAGAVAGVTTVRNPILLARAVMERSEHVFLAGPGADAFAEAQGLEIVPPAYFGTEARREALRRARTADASDAPEPNGSPNPGQNTATAESGPEAFHYASPNAHRFGTVGAVALDQQGRVAAATSTGGMTNKRWGRIGDVPVIGAGTYADPACAVSGTGWGEYFIMNTVARDVCARRELEGLTLQAAADRVIQEILPAQAEDTGGVIALGSDGEVVWSFNTPGMYRGRIDQDGDVTLGIFREDG